MLINVKDYEACHSILKFDQNKPIKAMKNTLLTFAIVAAFGAFTVSAYAFSNASNPLSIVCEGGLG